MDKDRNAFQQHLLQHRLYGANLARFFYLNAAQAIWSTLVIWTQMLVMLACVGAHSEMAQKISTPTESEEEVVWAPEPETDSSVAVGVKQNFQPDLKWWLKLGPIIIVALTFASLYRPRLRKRSSPT